MRIPSTCNILLLLTILLVCSSAKPSFKCAAYLLKLKNLYQLNKTLFLKQIAPYMLFSGKQLQDMGFPSLCKDMGYTYTTVQIQAKATQKHMMEHHSDFDYHFYYGLCFTGVCSVSDLNEGGKFIINAIFELEPIKINHIEFVDISTEKQFSPSSLIVCLLITVWIFICMIGLFSKWISQCRQKRNLQSSEVQISIPLHSEDKQVEQQPEYQQPINNHFLKKISIGVKWNSIWKSQESNKIVQFSKFKIFAVPLLMYGQFFYLCNIGSFNLFSFNDQIYETLYSKVATFAYYLPDIFFFISGFLLTQKIFREVEYVSNKPVFLLKCYIRKLIRLYPIYMVCLLIYYFVIPSLHAGPIWFVYTDEIGHCSSSFWANLLLINNLLSSHDCYGFSWWVAAEIQYTVVALVIFFLLFTKRIVGTIAVYLTLLTGIVLMFVDSAKLPVEIQITTDHHSVQFFKSFHSHLPFYMIGVVLALILQKQSSRKLIINYYLKSIVLLIIGNLTAIAIILLVLLRPATFQYDLLGFQLSISRIGVMFSFLVFFMPGLVKQRANRTVLHKLASLTYPIILVSGMIIGASFWGMETFPYASGTSLLYNLVPNLLLSISVGVVLDLLFNFSRRKSQIVRTL